MSRYWQRHQENLKIWIRCAIGRKRRVQSAANGHKRTFAIDRYLLRNSRSNYKSAFLYQRRISKWVF